MDKIIISDTSCLIALINIGLLGILKDLCKEIIIKGRTVAKSYNLKIIGTIGVLLLADQNGLIKDFMSTIRLLVTKRFRVSDKLIEKLINKYGSK